MTTVRHEPESNDASIEALLREVGARDEPSPATAAEVMSAVHAEWLNIVQERRRHQRVLAWRMAAGAVLAIGATTFAYRFMAPAPAQFASVSYVDGHLLAGKGNSKAEARDVGQVILVGENMQTDAQSRAAVSFPDGLSLRLDHDTQLTVDATDRITLAAGAVYIDAPPSATSANTLTVETSAGSVQHVGTQYEVRTQPDAMVVSVREGRVRVMTSNISDTGEAGQVLHLTNDGELRRSTLDATDPHWQWAMQAGPQFDIDNQPLAAFLQWVARETGRHVVYSTPEAEAAARAVKLRGSIAGLDADVALTTVLATTRLRRYQTNSSEIGIELAPIDSTAPARQTH
jgi:ferric-dicitrate binding protein FerR (iron transport regulator)